MQNNSSTLQRTLETKHIECDLAIVGGGLAGACCAITAARAGLKVVLIGDRPVLGGNASSEVRLWTLGATAHMAAPNRWAREGGVIDEILVENLWRNPEGNPILFDLVLLEKVMAEPNCQLLLNTAVYEIEKSDADTISGATAFCSQNSTQYKIRAPLWVDASGDGIVGFLSGAAFRMGAESQDEFGEKFAPPQEYGELLGHSIYFYSKDLGKPVTYIPPSFALDDITKIPRFRSFNAREHGCKLWWIEYGGRLDTVHETETIKWELWKVVYGVWNHIKNSGEFPEAENLTLEWVGHIPGKRESRRFEGDVWITQQDVIEQKPWPDAVSFGGWALDLHPADGVYSPYPGCTHWRMKGMYALPYRAMYSKNINNLFLAGRILSATHAAFGSTRVMATLAHAAQAVAFAAKLCHENNVLPREVGRKYLQQLQLELNRSGQHIPNVPLQDNADLAQNAQISATSTCTLGNLPADAEPIALDRHRAMLLPMPAGPTPQWTFTLDVAQSTTLEVQLRISSKRENHDGNEILQSQTFTLQPGSAQKLSVQFDTQIDTPRYIYLALMKNEHVSVHLSQSRLSGVLSLKWNNLQAPKDDIGVETFEIWTPDRRPNGRNFALQIEPPLPLFAPENILNGYQRPTNATNAWAAELKDPNPTLSLRWPQTQTIARIELSFDCDWDHPLESVLMTHPERAIPFCVRHFQLLDAQQNVIAEIIDNHQTRCSIQLEKPIHTDTLHLQVLASHGTVPATVFEVRCYEK